MKPRKSDLYLKTEQALKLFDEVNLLLINNHPLTKDEFIARYMEFLQCIIGLLNYDDSILHQFRLHVSLALDRVRDIIKNDPSPTISIEMSKTILETLEITKRIIDETRENIWR
jgi:hypothetical protein